ncbi:hypothetical protein [Mesorhizobium sp.]|nr:hypothetical protein [Mesorhizobium sp.]
MPENTAPRPPAPNDIRLRKLLGHTLTVPHWPEARSSIGMRASA